MFKDFPNRDPKTRASLRRVGDAPTTRQKAFSTMPMIVQPTTLLTPSITVKDGFRIAKA